MYDRPPNVGTARVDVRQRAVDIALTVIMQTEWLASRPTIVPIVAAGLDRPRHVHLVTNNVRRLADHIDRALEADPMVRRHTSEVVDAALVAAVTCRLFVNRWSRRQDADTERFNEDVQHLKHQVDEVLNALA
ncbi:hypothetical protein [Actinocrispum sp. NPDC049592]|uniref:hypothetical protein n=1 Tax=Actinocrispum sp. NPDC049592 TaxID=3154835 RepID=UPI00342A760C